MPILKKVQALSIKILENDRNLEKEENLLLKKAIDKKFSGSISM